MNRGCASFFGSNKPNSFVALTYVRETRYGGYAVTGILPRENRADFKKLHQSLIAELAPVGALEDDIVATITRLVWRKQNLEIFCLAEVARQFRDAIRHQHLATVDKKYTKDRPLPSVGEVEAAERKAAYETADREARKQLGDTYELAEMGNEATTYRLFQDLEVEERLNAMIDKCLKRLLFVRGLKSLPTACSSAPPQTIPEPPRLPRPPEAA
jgi:hypothetical protein